MAGNELKVLSAGAVKDGVAQIAAAFERTTGTRVTLDFKPAPELRDRIAAGEAADVVILPQSMMDGLAQQGKFITGSRAFLGRSLMGVTVHATAPAQDLANTEAFKRVVLGASAVVFNQASSGLYAAKLLEKLGLAKILDSKIIVVPSGAAIMEYVAEHPSAVGLAQISEIMVLIKKGLPVRLAAPLPDEIQNVTSYDAAATLSGAAQDAARALVSLLTSVAAKTVFAATGIH
ncbi:MAG: substrate-binding domain-containing protein [Sulfuricaulis sp.]|nr:substrate-binding domain-containing protein [Sulfuricaulis sp.]